MTVNSTYGFPYPQSSEPVANGASNIQGLADAVDAKMGLFKVIPTSATNGTVSADGDVTVNAAVASVTVQGAFSSSFDNYRVIWSGGTSSANDSAYQIRFANTAHHYAVIRYDSYLGAATSVLPTNAQTAAYFGISGQAKQDTMVLDIMNPFEAIFTKWTGLCTGNAYYGTGGGVYAQNTSISDFSIIAPFGTITGGTIRIYGYRN